MVKRFKIMGYFNLEHVIPKGRSCIRASVFSKEEGELGE